MNKTKIEWCDYTINPVKGYCPMACPYCYARALYDRFKWDKTIRFDADTLWGCEPKKPSRIFIGSTMELFGDWIPEDWMRAIFQWIQFTHNKRHTFIFLTKQPHNLAKWSPFPENCYVGLTVTHQGFGEHNYGCDGAITALEDVEATVKFISFEPLLSRIPIRYYVDFLRVNVDWFILGGQSGAKKFYPPEEWISEIEQVADKAGIPVFEKDNLRKTWSKGPRREFPK